MDNDCSIELPTSEYTDSEFKCESCESNVTHNHKIENISLPINRLRSQPDCHYMPDGEGGYYSGGNNYSYHTSSGGFKSIIPTVSFHARELYTPHPVLSPTFEFLFGCNEIPTFDTEMSGAELNWQREKIRDLTEQSEVDQLNN